MSPIDCFREKGYDHTPPFRDITDALGMSKGAVYHHFKSKEDILDKLTDRYYDEMGWFPGHPAGRFPHRTGEGPAGSAPPALRSVSWIWIGSPAPPPWTQSC